MKGWSILVCVLTAHFALHMNPTDMVENHQYRVCDEDFETTKHFSCHCPVFMSSRSQNFGYGIISYIFQRSELEDIK